MEKLFLRYLQKLFIQYKESLGNNTLSLEDYQLKMDFYNWIQKYQTLLEKYHFFLKKYGIIKLNSHIVEIGKGTLDSVFDKGQPITLMTPYATLFDKQVPNVINGKLNLNDKYPYIQSIYKSYGIGISNVSNFITQNPYNKKDIINQLIDIYTHQYNVCLGMFGNVSDQDLDIKMETLKKFSHLVNGKLQTERDEKIYVGMVCTNDEFKKTF